MTTPRPDATGFNGAIAYAMPDRLGEYAYVCPRALSDAPTGDDEERTIYVTRSASTSSTCEDEICASNFRSLRRDYPDRFLEVSYTYSHVLALDITDRDDDEDVRALLDILIHLDDEYPLYDEDDHSALQSENQTEYLASNGAWDFRREVGDAADDLADEAIADALTQAVYEHDFYGDWDGSGFRAWDDLVTTARATLNI